jgi:hypothetical protein
VPTIFLVLDDEEKDEVIGFMKQLMKRVEITAIVITDIRDKASKDFFDVFAEKRVF